MTIIHFRDSELDAAYERIEELEYALKCARAQVITLGGVPTGDEFEDQVQAAVIFQIDDALSGDVR